MHAVLLTFLVLAGPGETTGEPMSEPELVSSTGVPSVDCSHCGGEAAVGCRHHGIHSTHPDHGLGPLHWAGRGARFGRFPVPPRCLYRHPPTNWYYWQPYDYRRQFDYP